MEDNKNVLEEFIDLVWSGENNCDDVVIDSLSKTMRCTLDKLLEPEAKSIVGNDEVFMTDSMTNKEKHIESNLLANFVSSVHNNMNHMKEGMCRCDVSNLLCEIFNTDSIYDSMSTSITNRYGVSYTIFPSSYQIKFMVSNIDNYYHMLFNSDNDFDFMCFWCKRKFYSYSDYIVTSPKEDPRQGVPLMANHINLSCRCGISTNFSYCGEIDDAVRAYVFLLTSSLSRSIYRGIEEIIKDECREELDLTKKLVRDLFVITHSELPINIKGLCRILAVPTRLKHYKFL